MTSKLTERQRMDLLLIADDMSVSGDAKLADALRSLLAPTQQPSEGHPLKNPMVRFPTEEDIREWEEARKRKRQPSGEVTIDVLISIWSMRPQPGTPCGEAWERGARQGWEWAIKHATRAQGDDHANG
ncbi:hypothetical protein [Burkholderia ubonensis]|uniref:hypothetical protein n=1 Tax=Burkholderia ubonensis TaxID=101571 RepID=UPI00075D6B53|nr:hypothetical protein [Burkholderia ubonensis]KWK71685.1 hypothetical protein WM15_34780 [Burkholderia ubonensis]